MNLHYQFKFKRLIALLALIFGVASSIYAAERVEIDGLYYLLDTSQHTATVTYESWYVPAYTNLPEDVVIPSQVSYNNVVYDVTAIDNSAFGNCTSLKSISIPGSVTRIGSWNSGNSYLPFYKCTSLRSVRFEDGPSPVIITAGYESNGTGAGHFYYCPLEELYLGRTIIQESNTSDKDLSHYGYSPFYNQTKLTKVTIGENCTELLDYMFYGNSSLTIMALPNIERIGNHAFEKCSKLTTLNLGNKLQTVGDYAFYGCSNITKLTFPEALETIGAYAFCGCSSVTEITIGKRLKSIGDLGFSGCTSFTALILPDEFTTMGISAFEGCKKLTIAKLGESLEAVPNNAFKNCTSLAEMVIPASAVSIGDEAFYNDSGLATITMNEGLETIGSRVFWNNSGVMQFTIPGTVKSIGSNSFYGCTRTTYLTFRDGEETITLGNGYCNSSQSNEVGKYDYFYDCPIRVLYLGRNLTYSYSNNYSNNLPSAPFANKTTLKSVTIGPKVTFLYHDLFDSCTNLSSLKMGQNIETIYTYAFRDCDSLEGIDFPRSVKEIGDCAFYNCDKLAYTTYQEATDHTLIIGQSAFYNLPCLEEVTFPGQLNNLGKESFSDCPKLSTTIFNDTKISENNLIIDDSAFYNCGALKTVKFPMHLYKISDYVYINCISLNELSFPANLISIGNYVFDKDNSLSSIIFEDSNNAVKLGFGCNKSKSLFGDCNLQSLYMGRNIEYNATSSYGYSPFCDHNFLTDVRFSQAGTVTYCKDYLLFHVRGCQNLKLPESLTSIGNYTFAEMTDLSGIAIPDKVTTVGTYAFTNNKSMKHAKLSASCPRLREGLFADCDSLASISIPPVVNKMDTKMFRNCLQLADVTFEDNTELLEIGYGASETNYGLFRDCQLETLYLGRWLSYNTEIAERAPFYSIAALKNLTFGEAVGVVDKYMFSYCTGLEDLYLPDNIESVGLWGFRGCSSLKTVRFSENLSQVSDYGFSECTSLDNVVFPESMTSIADNSFSNCTSLKNLDLGNSLMIIGPSAFKNDTALNGVEIPESLYGLGVESFANCTSLPYVAIRAISSVGKQAFQGCTGLQWVSLSKKTTSLGENSFDGCSNIRYVKSFADFPPEGLVNFPEKVVAEGTLFVPEESVDYYQFSPTWEDWYSIRPITDDILASYVNLDITEHTFKAEETLQLTATVGDEDATDKAVIWRSADDAIATVSSEGLITAVSVGETIVTAWAADGSGEKAECHITVEPILVETISLSADNNTVKKGRNITISAKVVPENATTADVKWQTSNYLIASVSANGEVSAIRAGEVVITAEAVDGSGVVGTFTLTVIPPTKGDSNDNDEVTITDAVNTANYAMGINVENFNFEAADVNADKRITVADASGTITELLNQEVESQTKRNLLRNKRAEFDNIDKLVISNYSCPAGETSVVAVSLDNSRDYVALQADIRIPEGMEILGVECGERAAAYHTIQQRLVNDNTLRIVLFDIDNNIFIDNAGDIMSISIKTDSGKSGDIEIINILASDAQANEYVLSSVGGHNTDLSAIDSIIGDGNIKIEATPEGIIICNAEGMDIHIFTVDGMGIATFKANSNRVDYKLSTGVYVVTAGEVVSKVMVN